MKPPRTALRSDVMELIRSWERTAPWHRKLSAHLGLQGKLTLGFMLLLSLALVGSCWHFLGESRAGAERVAKQQALTVSRTLAMAGNAPLQRGDHAEFDQIGKDFLQERSIAAVAFYDAAGQMVSCASKDESLLQPALNIESLGASRTYKRMSQKAGRVVEVTAPIVPRTGGTPLGFVTVCFSTEEDAAQLIRIGQTVLLIGASVSLVCFPLVYGLINRIFLPIRELVDATQSIAGGDLDTQVAVHRPDVIGQLARSFNEMIYRIRGQQVQLQSANILLADANDALENKVRQRTAELEAANKRLQCEIAEKEDFLRAVSHDLNAPLRNISGMASTLLEKYRERFDEDVIHRLQRIQRNVEVETDLIGELLELSRIRTDPQTEEPVNIDRMVREVGEMFESDLKTRRINFVVEGSLPTVLCQKPRIRQVFQNLIDNAIKYMGDEEKPGAESAGIRVENPDSTPESFPITQAPAHSTSLREPRRREIRVGCVIRPENVEFYVRDTGVGIEPEDLEKVFFVFRRGRGAAVQRVTGKGVGLASVKSIIEMHGGAITVDSEVGHGSTFRFTLRAGRVLNRAA